MDIQLCTVLNMYNACILVVWIGPCLVALYIGISIPCHAVLNIGST